MKKKIVLASHGRLASGILSSLELICGKTMDITTLDCYLDETFDLVKSVEKIFSENHETELIVVTDLFGGSVNNEFLRYIDRPSFYLIAGLNLPLLIELVSQIEQTKEISETIDQVMRSSKETIQFCNLTVKQIIEEEEF